MAASNNTRSIPDIFIDAVGQFTILVRKEARLARTELSEKIMDLGVGIGLLGGGSVLLIPALVILLQAAVAALIVGGATLAIAVLLLATEVLPVKAANPVPRKTIAQLQHDGEMAKYQLRNDHGTTERAA
jgi:Putative Actinobacterial Holin-X, holin superfamily III